jgi:UPF0271 protein
MGSKITFWGQLSSGMKIDLNCDMGEGSSGDESIMPFITSANIACGMHAGDPLVMQKSVRLAKQFGVTVGAHPGWPDRQGYGRREMSFTPDEVEDLVLHQVGALAAIAMAEGVVLHHVKPHGALYNQAVKDRNLADAIARAVKRFSRDLLLVGLAGSPLVDAGVAAGLKVVHEGFPDRNYNLDGTLVSRRQTDAIIESPGQVAAHAVALAAEGILFADRHITIGTLCLHGDHVHAVDNARLVRAELERAAIQIAAP